MATTIQPFRRSYLIPAFAEASVADVMRLGVISCSADTPLERVAATMAAQRVHAVVVAGTLLDPVLGEHLVWGFVSDMDLMRAGSAGDITGIRAGDVTSTAAVTVEPTTSLAEAAKLMDEYSVAHLVVVAGGEPIGVVSTLDLAGALAWGGR
jgi:CBS domain-containing protein